jgi:hypothetical protein
MITFLLTIQGSYKYPCVQSALTKAEEILRPGSDFLQKVEKIDLFATENISGKNLVNLFQQTRQVKVSIYRPLNEYSRSLGYVEDGKDEIFLNTYRLEGSPASIIASVVHEVVHVLDFHSPNPVFGHWGNFAKGKENSLLYKQSIVGLSTLRHSPSPEDFSRPQKYGSFVFYNGLGYEIPRDGVYSFTKSYFSKEACCAIL